VSAETIAQPARNLHVLVRHPAAFVEMVKKPAARSSDEQRLWRHSRGCNDIGVAHARPAAG
jgi:hypothetical protein